MSVASSSDRSSRTRSPSASSSEGDVHRLFVTADQPSSSLRSTPLREKRARGNYVLLRLLYTAGVRVDEIARLSANWTWAQRIDLIGVVDADLHTISIYTQTIAAARKDSQLTPPAAGARLASEKLGIRYVYACPVSLPSPHHRPPCATTRGHEWRVRGGASGVTAARRDRPR
jgi:hypothetical protein